MLDIWRDRFGGANDPLQWILYLQLAAAVGEPPKKTVPAALSAEVEKGHNAINAYFDNVRYVLLHPLVRVWGGRPIDDAAMADLREAFAHEHALQCGYCTPGMVLAAVSLIESGEATDEDAIREGLEGNLCRCTGYHNIVQAVASAAGVVAS